MSFAYPRHLLSEEQKSTILKLLNFKPIKPFVKKSDNYYRFNDDEEDEADIIQFYKNEKIDNINYIFLPYLFSNVLLDIIPNDFDFPTCTINFTGQLRDYQVVVFEEAMEQLKAYGTTTLGLYPGFGKTIEGARIASELGLITLVYCHRETLAHQWKITFESFTNAEVWVVGQQAPNTCNVVICMDTRFSTIPKEMMKDVGLLIVDEAHTFCTASRMACLLAVQPKYIIIETATLIRDDGMHEIMYAMVGEHGIHRTDNKAFKVHKINTGITPERKTNRMGTLDWSHLQKTSLMIPQRVNKIIDIVKENIEEKTLILTAVVDHAKLIEVELIKEKIEFDVLYRNKKNYIDGKVLIGTISKIGTGFDQATFCEKYDGIRFKNLILASSIKKVSLLEQSVGRVFRADFPVVYHLVDNDDIFRNHWRIAKKWYISRGGEIIGEERVKRKKVEKVEGNLEKTVTLLEAQEMLKLAKKSGSLDKLTQKKEIKNIDFKKKEIKKVEPKIVSLEEAQRLLRLRKK